MQIRPPHQHVLAFTRRTRRPESRRLHGYPRPSNRPETEVRTWTPNLSSVNAQKRGHDTISRAPLEDLYRSFDHTESATDPIHIVRRFSARGRPRGRRLLRRRRLRSGAWRACCTRSSRCSTSWGRTRPPSCARSTRCATRAHRTARPSLDPRARPGRSAPHPPADAERVRIDRELLPAGRRPVHARHRSGARLVFLPRPPDGSARAYGRRMSKRAGVCYFFPAARRPAAPASA